MATPARVGQAIVGDFILGVVENVVAGAVAINGTSSATFSATVERAVFATVTIPATATVRFVGTVETGVFVSGTATATATVTFTGSYLKTAAVQTPAGATVAFKAALTTLGSVSVQGTSTAAFLASYVRLAGAVAAGSAGVTFNGTRIEATSVVHIPGVGTATFNGTTIGSARLVINGAGTAALFVSVTKSVTVTINGTSIMAWSGLLEKLSRFVPNGVGNVAFKPVAIYAASWQVSGLGTVLWNAQSIQADTIPQAIGIGRIRVDIYDPSGAKVAAGPLSTIIECKYGQHLNEIGTFSMRVPADDENLATIGHRYELWIYREGEGLVFKGEVGLVDTVASGDRLDAVISGSSVARKLVRYNTGMGLIFNGSTLAAAVTTLLGSTGWTNGALDSPATTAHAEFNGLSRWAALGKIADLFGLHLREDVLSKQVDIGAFGTDSGLVFQNVEQASPVLRQNLRFAPISIIGMHEDSQDLYNKITPVGGGEGVNALTLKWSTRSTPYAIQAFTAPDGISYPYIQDAASITQYGLSEEIVLLNDAVPLANSLAGFQNAANAMYDIVAARLTRKKVPISTYEGEVVGLRHIVNNVPTFEVGQKANLRYNGVIQESDGTKRAYKSINQNVWIMGYERTLVSDGSDVWQFTLSTIDRDPETLDSMVAQQFEDFHAIEVTKRNYTFQAPYILNRISIQSGSTATLYAKLDANISLLHLAKLSWIVRPVRSNVSVAASGGASTASGGTSHSHNVSGQSAQGGGSHGHDLSPLGGWSEVFAYGIGHVSSTDPASLLANHNHASATTDAAVPNNPHSHTVSGGTGGMGGAWQTRSFMVDMGVVFPDIADASTTHTHTITATTSGAESSHTHTTPDHTHTLTYGIYTGPNPTNPAITININGVDRTAALGGPFNTVGSEVIEDITQYLQSGGTEQPNRATNTIVFGASVLCDIEAILRLDLTRSALLPV